MGEKERHELEKLKELCEHFRSDQIDIYFVEIKEREREGLRPPVSVSMTTFNGVFSRKT
jgi:hypothetical protein